MNYTPVIVAIASSILLLIVAYVAWRMRRPK